MNLLNQKMLIESVVEPTGETIVSDNTSVTAAVVPDVHIDDTPGVANKIVTDIPDTNTYTLTKKDNSDLDDIEDQMEVEDMNGMDMVIECISNIENEINSIRIQLNNDTAKAHAAQYNALTECAENERADAMHVLYETTISSLWQSFIDALTKFVEKVKRAAADISFKAVAYFDSYGKWATKYEEALNNATATNNGTKKYITTYKWKKDKLFQITDFSRIHEYASTILGYTTNPDEMAKKLAQYESRNWNTNQIYGYIFSKCVGLKGNFDEGKAEAHKLAIDQIRGPKTNNVELSMTKIQNCIKDLKSIRSYMLKYASSSKLSLINPEFDTLLRDAKKESKNISDQDTVRYKYYKTRYNILSQAQEVAFDIYYMKARLLKEYANSCMEICKAYTNDVTTESIDYFSMRNSIIDNAQVLD